METTGNKCLQLPDEKFPNYARAAVPGELLGSMTPGMMPPAAAPNPVLNDSDLADPPIQLATRRAPPPSSNMPRAPSPSGQPPKVVSRTLLCLLAVVVGGVLMY